MAEKDKRISDYIAHTEEFAQPILNHLRALIHETCPDIRETIKWGVPHFEYAGGILCSMAAFKNHCAFSFWLGSMVKDPGNVQAAQAVKTGMGDFGKLKSLADLPAKKTLAGYIRRAMALNEHGVKRSRFDNTSPQAKTVEVPDYFLEMLKKNKKAAAAFERFSYSHRKEYVEWIAEAKTEQTRNKRMATALEWLAEGKGRNWKYQKQ